jgi:hypothetical protein
MDIGDFVIVHGLGGLWGTIVDKKYFCFPVTGRELLYYVRISGMTTMWYTREALEGKPPRTPEIELWRAC